MTISRNDFDRMDAQYGEQEDERAMAKEKRMKDAPQAYRMRQCMQELRTTLFGPEYDGYDEDSTLIEWDSDTLPCVADILNKWGFGWGR